MTHLFSRDCEGVAGLDRRRIRLTDWLDWTDEQIAVWQRVAIAVMTDDLTTMELLADEGFDFDQRGPGWTGAIYVARTVYRDDPGHSLLEFALEHGDDPRTVTFLLEHGISPNDSYWSEMTPLGHAVEMEAQSHLNEGNPMDCRIVAPLLEAGADPLLLPENGRTALDIARSYSHHAAVQLMERHLPS